LGKQLAKTVILKFYSLYNLPSLNIFIANKDYF
jgi:hypothetical protein